MTIDQTPVVAHRTDLSPETVRGLRRELEAQREEHVRMLDALPPAHLEPVAAQQAHAARTAVAQIDRALRRLAEGGYGQCATCDEPIPAARLEARPHTEHCVPCQEAAAR